MKLRLTEPIIPFQVPPHWQSDSREMANPSLVDDYSPWSPDMVKRYLGSPQDSTMNTPPLYPDYRLEVSQMLTGFPLFPLPGVLAESKQLPKYLPKLDPPSLIVMTPTTPLHDSAESFDQFASAAQQAQLANTSGVIAKLLESSLERERQEKEQWRERALMLSSVLTGLNLPVPDFTVIDL